MFSRKSSSVGVAKPPAFFQRAWISNSHFTHGRVIRFAGEERFMNVLWILVILKWLSIMVESWQAFEFFGWSHTWIVLSHLKRLIFQSHCFSKLSLEKCYSGKSNPGPLVQHACITAHDTCLWHVGGLSNILQTNYWVAPLMLINKLNYIPYGNRLPSAGVLYTSLSLLFPSLLFH